MTIEKFKGDVKNFEEFFCLLRQHGHKIIHPDTGKEWKASKQVPVNQINIGVHTTIGAKFVFNKNIGASIYRNLIFEYCLVPFSDEDLEHYKKMRQQEQEARAADALEKAFVTLEKDLFEKVYIKADSVASKVIKILELPENKIDEIKCVIRTRIKKDLTSPVKPSAVTRYIEVLKNSADTFLGNLGVERNRKNREKVAPAWEDRWTHQFPYTNSSGKVATQLIIEQANNYNYLCGDYLGGLEPSPDKNGNLHLYGDVMIQRMIGEVEWFASLLDKAYAVAKSKEKKKQRNAMSTGSSKREDIYKFIDSLCTAYISLTKRPLHYRDIANNNKERRQKDLVPFISTYLRALNIPLSERKIADYIDFSTPSSRAESKSST